MAFSKKVLTAGVVALLAGVQAQQTCNSAGLYALNMCGSLQETGSSTEYFKFSCNDEDQAQMMTYSDSTCATMVGNTTTLDEGLYTCGQAGDCLSQVLYIEYFTTIECNTVAEASERFYFYKGECVPFLVDGLYAMVDCNSFRTYSDSLCSVQVASLSSSRDSSDKTCVTPEAFYGSAAAAENELLGESYGGIAYSCGAAQRSVGLLCAALAAAKLLFY